MLPKVRYIFDSRGRIPSVLFRYGIVNPFFAVKNFLFRVFKFCFADDFILENLRGLHKGETIIVVGNGPSISGLDFNELSKYTTLGSNKIYLMSKRNGWKPTYYVVEDDLVIKQNYDEISSYDGVKKLFPSSMLGLTPRVINSVYFRFHTKKFKGSFPNFSSDVFRGLYWGSTVVYTQIQLAAYMGAKNIVLVGVDFNFDIPESQKGVSKEIVCEGEVNHFDSNYRVPGEKWNLPNLDLQICSFEVAAKYCKEKEIGLYNATIGTKLDRVTKKAFPSLYKE